MENAPAQQMNNENHQNMEGADDDNPPLGGDLNSHPQEDDVAPRELPTPPTSPPPPAPQASSGADDDDDGAFSPREQEAVEAAVVAPPSLPSPPTSLSPATELRPRQEAAELPRILPMDEDDGAGRGEDEDDDESVHRHPVSTSHDGLPEILPLDGLAAAAATAQHRPAQDVMPAFGQLMGNDVRPGLATPAYLRQPTLHYNKRKRRGHEYAQQPAPPSTAAPDNGRVVEIDLTDDTAYSAVPASSFPSSMGPNPSSSSSLHPPHPSSSSSSGPHLSQEALRLLMRSMPPQPSLLTRLNNSTQPFPTINPYQAQYQPLTTTTTTSSTSAASYPPPEIDLTQEDDIPLTYVRTDEDSDADEEEICMEIPFGQVLAKVVNTQYFTGILTERETVRLALDHNNIYDQTAIRVENVMGSEVGLLDKRIAACFAPLMERRIMRLQAVIAQKPAANTSIQVILQMFGQPDQKNTVIDRVMEFNLQLEKYVPTKRNVILPSEDHYRAGGSSLQLVGASNGMSLSELEGDVEKLFKSLQDEAANLPEQEPPEPITSRLFPHQKQALYWMSSKEQIRNTFSDEYKVLFWHKRIINGETVYFNSATNSTVKELPPNAQGGILADDMGLGKTLCVISLIMSEIAERKRSRDGATVTASAPASDSAARGEAEPADGEKGKEKEKDLEAEMDSEEVDQSLQQQQRQSPPPPPQQQQQQQQLEDSDDVVEVIEEIDEDLIIFSPPQKRRRPEGFGEFTTSASTRGASVDPPKERPTATLIVCPLSIMSNWEQQISQHVDQEWMEANGVSIYIYHGAGRTKDVEELKKHSIVITTYNILATEYRDEDATANRKKPGRKARGPAASSSVPLDLTSNPSPSSSASSSSSSLSSLLPAYGGMNGGATSSSFVQSALSRFHQFAEFQQPYPSSSSSSSSSAGVVETPASPSQSPLQEINWLRIVLDEGHIIKTRSTRQAKAAFALQAERRWVLTGTPIQNKLDDLFSLIHFVRVHPFENYDWWTSIIVRPMQQEEPKGYQRLQALVGSICLRRTKDQHDRHGRPLVGLPEKKIFIERLKFSAEEKLRYDEIVSQGRKIFSAYMSQGTLLKNYAHVLEMLLRLRQVCCHPRLAAPKPPSYGASIDDEKAEHLLALLQGGEGEECCICLSAMSDPVITTCTHIYCKPCITRAMELSPHCPLCRAPITPESLLVPPPMVQNADVIIEGEKLGRSTKVKFLLKHIQQMKHADPTAKCVIFSQWTSFLDILRQPLEEDKIGFVGLDGRMNHQKRKEVMDTFNNDPSVTALLISLKAGGVGLNLTVASVVFLMDPWWNPAGEEQAMDRVHRLGQTKDVKCVRFVIQDSVEERMLKLQEKKRCMVQGAFGKRSIAELQAMRINELKLLFDDGPL